MKNFTYVARNIYNKRKRIIGKAKNLNDLKKKLNRKFKWRRIKDLENYIVSVCLKGDEIKTWGVEIIEFPKEDYSMYPIEDVRMTYKLPEWILLNEDFDYRTSEYTGETETYDFYTHSDINKYDIVYCTFDKQYYIVLGDLSDPWGYNSDKLIGGNLFPEEGATVFGISQYYIEKAERDKIPKNILKALDDLIESFKDGSHDPLDKGKTFDLHRKLCEAQGIEFDDYV